ncbi:MAG: CHAD domain-containing protein [Acidimicrobiales bacterium]|nr:CHAD domain-containing protein [Acidimicrobiales bacterium]
MATRGVPLDGQESAAAGLARLLGAELDVVVAEAPGIVADDDIEHLHRWRVAIRRSRSILAATDGVLDDGAIRHLRRDLRALIRVSGPLRDLDVWLRDLDAILAGVGGDLSAVRSLLERDRDAARAAQLALLASDEHRAVLADWSDLVAAGAVGREPWGEASSLGEAPSLGAVAASALDDAHRRVRRRGRRVLEGGPPAAVHDLRKRAKDLRYLLESFAPLAPASLVDGLAVPLRALQDVLGDYQDDEVRLGDLDRFAREAHALGAAGAEAAAAADALAETIVARHDAARAAVDEATAALFAKPTRRAVIAVIEAIATPATPA